MYISVSPNNAFQQHAGFQDFRARVLAAGSQVSDGVKDPGELCEGFAAILSSRDVSSRVVLHSVLHPNATLDPNPV